MNQRMHLNNFMHGGIVGKLKEGCLMNNDVNELKIFKRIIR